MLKEVISKFFPVESYRHHEDLIESIRDSFDLDFVGRCTNKEFTEVKRELDSLIVIDNFELARQCGDAIIYFGYKIDNKSTETVDKVLEVLGIEHSEDNNNAI